MLWNNESTLHCSSSESQTLREYVYRPTHNVERSAMTSEHECHHSTTRCCSIIPPYILASIANHASTPESVKASARNSLLSTTLFHQNREYICARRRQGGGVIAGHTVNLPTTSAGPKRLNRMIYSAEHTMVLDKTVLRSEGKPAVPDSAANECYDGFGSTFKFYSDIFDRNSIDNAGMSLIGTVHYLQGYQNAQWNGAQMIFGDGDGTYFNRFTTPLEIVGHELTHGVTQYTANLVFKGISGALNESMSDVFGIMVKQYMLNQTSAQSDWLIGVGLFTSRVNGVALRSMKDPGSAYDDPALGGKDPQPRHFSQVNTNLYPDDLDDGGVHVFSGVPNHAFYLVATRLGGYAWDRAGRIWYSVLSGGKLPNTANFHVFATMTCDEAERLFGTSVKTVVEQAWGEVGVVVGTGPPQPPQPLPQITAAGKWSGTIGSSRIELTCSVFGQTLTGSGSMIDSANVASPFTVVNGHYGLDRSVRFEAMSPSPHTSKTMYYGVMAASGMTISGSWESAYRIEFLKLGYPDSILSGTFNLTRTS
ncbi:hypothetical protein BXZ70DRAFT_56150 [Cristinia sonorae]|uniref:Neutral metalloproteinase n=1 Tax=Cristinia sonorae TaxID=1940300 RepID=A0A8K0US15_9AGAR|nr:hypothetical protein BXZ70DRAFT_56150 [Cristinia sonorae]